MSDPADSPVIICMASPCVMSGFRDLPLPDNNVPAVAVPLQDPADVLTFLPEMMAASAGAGMGAAAGLPGQAPPTQNPLFSSGDRTQGPSGHPVSPGSTTPRGTHVTSGSVSKLFAIAPQLVGPYSNLQTPPETGSSGVYSGVSHLVESGGLLCLI